MRQARGSWELPLHPRPPLCQKKKKRNSILCTPPTHLLVGPGVGNWDVPEFTHYLNRPVIWLQCPDGYCCLLFWGCRHAF